MAPLLLRLRRGAEEEAEEKSLTLYQTSEVRPPNAPAPRRFARRLRETFALPGLERVAGNLCARPIGPLSLVNSLPFGYTFPT